MNMQHLFKEWEIGRYRLGSIPKCEKTDQKSSKCRCAGYELG